MMPRSRIELATCLILVAGCSHSRPPWDEHRIRSEQELHRVAAEHGAGVAERLGEPRNEPGVYARFHIDMECALTGDAPVAFLAGLHDVSDAGGAIVLRFRTWSSSPFSDVVFDLLGSPALLRQIKADRPGYSDKYVVVADIETYRRLPFRPGDACEAVPVRGTGRCLALVHVPKYPQGYCQSCGRRLRESAGDTCTRCRESRHALAVGVPGSG